MVALIATMAQMRSTARVCALLQLEQMSWSVAWAPNYVKMAQNVSSSVMFVMERETVKMDQTKMDVVSFCRNVSSFQSE